MRDDGADNQQYKIIEPKMKSEEVYIHCIPPRQVIEVQGKCYQVHFSEMVVLTACYINHVEYQEKSHEERAVEQ
jgi:hypothetical protein